MSRRMYYSERTAYARMGRGRRLLHRVIRLLTTPRPLWRLWWLYRRTWPR